MVCGASSSKQPPVAKASTAQEKPARKPFFGKARRRVAPEAVAVQHEEQRWIFLGCDNAGKSTLMSALRLIAFDGTPTVGFDSKPAQLGGQPLRLFDVGGGKQIRSIWTEYYGEVHGVIFVVDAADPTRFDEARELLHAAYAAELLTDKPLLILANKKDLPQAIGAAELADVLRLHELRGSSYQVAEGTSLAPKRLGVEDASVLSALEWLVVRVRSDFGTLDERVKVAQKAKAEALERKRAERKARLEAKRAAKLAAEAEEQAKAAEAAEAAPALQPAEKVDAPMTIAQESGTPTKAAPLQPLQPLPPRNDELASIEALPPATKGTLPPLAPSSGTAKMLGE